MSEIQVTPEMIAAGIRAINISAYHSASNKPQVLREVYLAMRALEPVSIPYRPRSRVPEASEDPG